ncbi:MAG TPA: MBOAT family O-acyltransferase [Anaerolineales bacterium]|nr:MBOAT family O-acyltransferase [Anaerolineales bacterium]
MTILQIAILAVIALILDRLPKGRQLALLAVSIFVVFWLQPAEPFVSLAFWLPVATLTITVLAWALTSAVEVRGWKQNWTALAILAGVVLLMDLNRYFKLTQVYMSSTPQWILTILVVAAIVAAALVLAQWRRSQPLLQVAAFIVIILIFIFLKTPQLTAFVLTYLASVRQQSSNTVGTAFSWLGFSYLAFRLLHTIRDRQSGRLPAVTLAEYVNYVIFFPAFSAGPIDRLERFVKDLRSPLPLGDEDWIDAGTRLFVGLFKKFVVADLLAVISISDVLVSQVKGAGWMWIFLYAYSFRIYFDFSGYTDVAIGLGRLLGFRLPENFAAPYLKPNLTQFWNSWHMTLTQWFRSYFFNPLTRTLRSGTQLPIWIMILLTQISTMILIGMWHGITWNFVLWGAWHGLGLFIHNRWGEFIRNRRPAWTQSPNGQMAMNALGTLLTFNYVALGWLFFTLSTPTLAWQAMLKLFGLT